MNFRSIILPEAIKLSQASDPYFLSIISRLEKVMGGTSLPLPGLITQLELLHHNAIMGKHVSWPLVHSFQLHGYQIINHLSFGNIFIANNKFFLQYISVRVCPKLTTIQYISVFMDVGKLFFPFLKIQFSNYIVSKVCMTPKSSKTIFKNKNLGGGGCRPHIHLRLKN